MTSTNKRIISLNLALLLLFGLALPALAAEPAQPTPLANLQTAETASDAVQAEFIDESGNVLQTVEASADGWLTPQLPDAGSGNPFLYWFAWDENNGLRCCVPGVRYPKLTASTCFSPSRAASANGILYCDSSLLDWEQNVVWTQQAPMGTDSDCLHVNQYPAPKDGRRFFGWTLRQENTGAYFTYGDAVPGTDEGWVTLYAQWLPDGMAAIYIASHPELCAPQGAAITLPSAAREGYRLAGWSGHYGRSDGTGEPISAQETTDGWLLTVPEDAEQIYLNPVYYPTSPITIDGSTYLPSEAESHFSGNGWSMYYQTDGSYSVNLNNYHGSSIKIPSGNTFVFLQGTNSVTGGPDVSAIQCNGKLKFEHFCKHGSTHSSLTVTASSTQHAVKATVIELASHVTLVGGAGSTALSPDTVITEGEWFSLYGGASAATVSALSIEAAARASYLEAKPIYDTMTIHGNGGTSIDNQPDLLLQFERGELIDLSTLGFSYARHKLYGYSVQQRTQLYNFDIIPEATEYTLLWKDAGADRFVTFDTVYPIVGGEAEKSWLFGDNATTVTAPMVTFADAASCGDLIYWHTSSSPYLESPNCHQYKPGEIVTEPDGTVLYARAVNAQCELVLDANGRHFYNGLKYQVTNGCYFYGASDGTQLLSWNTKPDGSGDRYEIGAIPNLQGRDTVLTLYAQWLPEDAVHVRIETQAGTTESYASVGDRIQLPESSPDAGYAFDHWFIWCTLQDRSVNLKSTEVDGIQYVQIPDGAISLFCSAYYYPTAAFIIDGAKYRFTSCEDRFTGDGWTLAYEPWDVVTLVLDGYHGSEIMLPARQSTIQVTSTSSVTANNGAAISCDGTLTFYNSCTGTKHPQLTATGADGFAAVSAAKLELCCPHLTLIGGNGANAVSAKQVSTDYRCTLAGGMDAASAKPISVAQAQTVRYLKTAPTYRTVVIHGNGAKTATGQTDITIQQECGAWMDLSALGFSYSRHILTGYIGPDGNSSDLFLPPPPADSVSIEYTLQWDDPGSDHYVIFDTVYPIVGGKTNQKSLLFGDNAATVVAPTVTFVDSVSCGNLIYWHTSPTSYPESRDCHQYKPGEIIKEPDNTVLYARAANPTYEVVLDANGKKFSNGLKYAISESCPEYSASDGARLLSWNTEPDGSGDRYEIGVVPPLADRTEPLILYAQWKPAAYTASLERTAAGITLSITPSAGSAAQPISPEQTVYVAAYRNGRMVTVMQGRVIGKQICCSVSDSQILQDCVLKLYVLNGDSAPDRQYEFVSLT